MEAQGKCIEMRWKPRTEPTDVRTARREEMRALQHRVAMLELQEKLAALEMRQRVKENNRRAALERWKRARAEKARAAQHATLVALCPVCRAPGTFSFDARHLLWHRDGHPRLWLIPPEQADPESERMLASVAGLADARSLRPSVEKPVEGSIEDASRLLDGPTNLG